MIQHYHIFSENDGYLDLDFDDNKSVKELIKYLFDKNGYYEPYGIDIVTLFQIHGSRGADGDGYFITDTQAKCANMIEYPSDLSIAYHMPKKFYFVEGGWGHHMIKLGNKPDIPNPVDLWLKFGDFDNTVVINGNYTFIDVINSLKQFEYIPHDSNRIMVCATNLYKPPYYININDPIMFKKLSDFSDEFQDAVTFFKIC